MQESLDSAELSSSDSCRKCHLLNLALPRSPDDEFKNCGKKEILGSKLSPAGGLSCSSFEFDLHQAVNSSPQTHLKLSLSSFDHQEQQQAIAKHTSTIFGNDRTNNSTSSFEQHDFGLKKGSLARIWESREDQSSGNSDEDDDERKEEVDNVSSESSLDEDPLNPFLPQLKVSNGAGQAHVRSGQHYTYFNFEEFLQSNYNQAYQMFESAARARHHVVDTYNFNPSN